MTRAVGASRAVVAVLGPLAVVLLVAIAYRGSLGLGFVYDDAFLIPGNALLHRGFDPLAIVGSAFWEHTALPSRAFYRPLAMLTYAFDVLVGGFAPAVFHLTNVLVHLANTALLALAVRSLGGGPWLATSAAAVFGLHPLNSEAVLWVSGRADLLAAGFSLLALVCFARAERPGARPRGGDAWLGGLALFLALLAKESATATVVILVVYVLVFASGGTPRMRALVPVATASAGYAALRLLVVGAPEVSPNFLGNPLVAEGASTRAWTVLDLFGRYVAKLVLPLRLSADYSFASIAPVTTPLAAGAVAGAVLLVAMIVAVHVTRRPLRLVSFGLTVFLAGVAVVLAGAVTGGGAMFAERYMYLPSAGFAIAVTAGAACLVARLRPVSWRAPLATAALLVVVGASLVRLSARVPEWRDDLALFSSVVAVTPDNAQAHNNLANALAKRGQREQARLHCLRALAIYPDYPNPLIGLGNIALDSGAPEQALPFLQRAAARWPQSDAPLSLGDAYMALGRLADAQHAYLTGWRASPTRALYLTSLGNVAIRMGQPEQAVQAWQEALRIDPGQMGAVASLAHHYELKGDLDHARTYYRRLLATDPPGFEMYKARGRRLLGAGRG